MTAAVFRWAAGLPDAVMITVVAVVGVLTVASLVRTAMRRTGNMRRAWLCIALTCVLWVVSNAWLLLDLPPALYWNVVPAVLPGLAHGRHPVVPRRQPAARATWSAASSTAG